ncbi:hypothetical protein [[Flexibacter] sp. ATCC 35208]|uniref:hypothetical protein n=1 Tax=[Flexibacter] sp. ATCC 35208 TaxID=1936242 RepID=UPI00118080C7|nr:hypothetical protein [[Flexibacter] sp. ATCC 35208]
MIINRDAFLEKIHHCNELAVEGFSFEEQLITLLMFVPDYKINHVQNAQKKKYSSSKPFFFQSLNQKN